MAFEAEMLRRIEIHMESILGEGAKQDLESANKRLKLHSMLANARVATVSAEYLAQSQISKTSFDGVVCMFRNGKQDAEKLVYAAFVGVFGWTLGQFLQVAAIAEEAYRIYVEAGRPWIATVLDYQVNQAISISWCYSSVFCGDLRRKDAHEALRTVYDELDDEQKERSCRIMTIFAGIWEPQCSQRVMHWQERAKSVRGPRPASNALWTMVGQFCDLMEEASQQRQCLDGCFHTHPGRKDSRAGSLKEEEDTWQKLLSASANVSVRLSMKIYPANVARNCIFEGCQVIFLAVRSWRELQSRDLVVSEVGMQHLSDASGVLSRCLQIWEFRSEGASRHHFLPCMLLWARAMLHWFQWRLWLCGELNKDEVTPIACPELWGPEDTCSPGIRQICEALVEAQHRSISDEERPELLSAGLPATIMLCRLLRGEGLPRAKPQMPSRGDHLMDSDTSDSVSVPANLKRAGASQGGGQFVNIIIGSLSALTVAQDHLGSMLSMLRTDGRYLPVDSAAGPSDVEDSETVWEAILLMREIKSEIEETTSVKPAWSPDHQSGIPADWSL